MVFLTHHLTDASQIKHSYNQLITQKVNNNYLKTTIENY